MKITPTFFSLLVLMTLVGCSKPAEKQATSVPVATNPTPSEGGGTATASPFIAPQNASPTPGVPPTGSATPKAEAPPPNYAAAKKEIETTIAQKPQSVTLRMQAAEFYMRAGDHAAALPHLEVVTKLAPKDLIGWIALGDANTFVRKIDKALAAYTRAEQIDPNNPFLLRGKSQALLLQKKFQEARQVLEKGLKTHPNDVELQTALGNIYLILNRPRQALETLEPAVKANPERADLHYLLGEAYERDLHINAALDQMRAAVHYDPRSAEAWGRIGLYSVNLTHYEEARQPLLKAIELEPNESHYYWALGDSYLLQSPKPENFAKATELYRKALSLDPKNTNALYSFAMALTRRGQKQDIQEAITLFQRLVKVNPEDLNAEYKMYEAYRDLGMSTESEAHRKRFQQLFALGHKQIRSLYKTVSFKDTAEAHLKMAQEAMKSGKYELASTEFQLALERNRMLNAARQGILEAQRHLGRTPITDTKTTP